MLAIGKNGLVKYVEDGGKLPPSKFIDTFHEHRKTFYVRNKLTLNLHGSYRGEPVIVIHNEASRQVLIFQSNPSLFLLTEFFHKNK